MNGVKNHTTEAVDEDDENWDATEEMILSVFEMYTKKEVWASVVDDTTFAGCKAKWDKLKQIYGGIGSISLFNNWVTLTGTTFDKASPMLPQIQKLNDARTNLQNSGMEISDLQHCFTLIKALPEIYSPVASTILATGAPADLKPLTIQERILNEEGWHARSSTSLNKHAPIKSKEKEDKKKIKCFYCNKKGHRSSECKKKKKDEEDKAKKEKEKAAAGQSSSTKVNAHVQLVPTTATIVEIPDDNEVRVSLYAV